MSDLSRCTGCKGQKKLSGLGGIKLIDCSDCNGIGWIKPLAQPIPDIAPEKVIELPKSEKPKKKSKKKSNK
jgi:hypothetical protein